MESINWKIVQRKWIQNFIRKNSKYNLFHKTKTRFFKNKTELIVLGTSSKNKKVYLEENY